MKLNVLLFASLFIICHLSSCNKNDESPDDPNLTASEGILKAKIDSELWSGYNFKATYYIKFNQLYIVGTDRKNKHVINLYVYVDPAASTEFTDSTNKTIDIAEGKLVVNDWEDMR